MTLLDRLGQTTEIEFERVERNPRLDPSTFRFTPPPGVDVVGRVPAG
jgi:outer membrane lipoprotein-sorting protein